MFCSSCGSPVNDGQKFCSKCGAPASPSGAPSPSGAAPVQPAAPARPPVDNMNTPPKAPEKKMGNRLAIISIAILIVSSAIFIPVAITRVFEDYMSVGLVSALIYVVAVMAAFVLMIVSVVKYRSTLSKVMIVIYTILFVLIITAVVIVMLVFLGSCLWEECTDCVHHF